MSRSWFPDLIGPSSLSANGGTPVGVRKRSLNILSSGVAAADAPNGSRIDLTIPDPAWSQIDAPTSTVGEWLPASTAYGAIDMVRVTSSVSGTILTGLDSTSDPTRLVKYVANYGSNSITIQPPASPVAGKQYFSGAAYTLSANSTVRVVWDVVTRVYRLRVAAFVPSSVVVLDGSSLALDGSHIANPS